MAKDDNMDRKLKELKERNNKLIARPKNWAEPTDEVKKLFDECDMDIPKMVKVAQSLAGDKPRKVQFFKLVRKSGLYEEFFRSLLLSHV